MSIIKHEYPQNKDNREYDNDAATRNMMEAQDKPVEGIPSPEITTALLDLARLSHRIELAAAEAPSIIAAALLERLVKLCKAERGAILLATQGPGEHQPWIWSSAREGKDG